MTALAPFSHTHLHSAFVNRWASFGAVQQQSKSNIIARFKCYYGRPIAPHAFYTMTIWLNPDAAMCVFFRIFVIFIIGVRVFIVGSDLNAVVRLHLHRPWHCGRLNTSHVKRAAVWLAHCSEWLYLDGRPVLLSCYYERFIANIPMLPHSIAPHRMEL